MTCTWPTQTSDNARARIAQYQDVLIPQRIATVTSAQQEVNYMLIGVFELLALKQDEYDAYQGYLEAIRDYWLARADLALATGTALPSTARIGEQRIDVGQFTQPPPALWITQRTVECLMKWIMEVHSDVTKRVFSLYRCRRTGGRRGRSPCR